MSQVEVPVKLNPSPIDESKPSPRRSPPPPIENIPSPRTTSSSTHSPTTKTPKPVVTTPTVERSQPTTVKGNESKSHSNLEDPIDMKTFQQVLDLDDEDETLEFSRGMTSAYFSQASETFEKMDSALSSKLLKDLSDLGHFLKGSSAALGVLKVQASCEKIQRYGQLRDEEAGTDLTDKQALEKISAQLEQVKGEYDVAEKWLKGYFETHGDKAP